MLIVSTPVAFMYLLYYCCVFAINRLCNDKLSLLHIIRAVARGGSGGSGGSAEPPSKLMIFMTIVLCLMEKLMAEIF